MSYKAWVGCLGRVDLLWQIENNEDGELIMLRDRWVGNIFV